MKLSRRVFLPLLGSGPFLISPAHLQAQGMATRYVKAAPRGKPSGIPFLAGLTDVGEAAGLTAPTIYGGVDHKEYIVETMGCGCAFFDYDNDGWLDALVL
jgi:enediyne biosynthesis protein E4